MSITKEPQTYYETLEVRRDATYEDLVRQFKSLSLRYHPLRNPTNMATNQIKFGEICEAFDVLSNLEHRAIYDTYGEYALKEGITTPEGSKFSI